MIVIKRKSLDKAIWSIFLFILFFYPPVIPYTNLLLSAISLLFLCIKYRNKVNRIMKKSKINLWVFGITILFMYVFIIPLMVSWVINDIVNLSHYVSLINRFAILVVTVVPCCILLICMLDEKGYDYHFFVETVINAGLIESFLVILSFLSPAVKTVFISLMAKNTSSELYENTWYITVRSYGFAGTLVDLFGLGVAVIAGISFFYGIIYRQRYMIYSILIVLGALLNARTGVVLYIISVMFAIVYILRQRYVKTILKTILGIIMIILMSIAIFYVISKNIATMGWIQVLLNSIRSTIRNQSTQGVIDKLFSQDFWEFPNVFRTIIGTAHSKYLAEGYSHSDVGYVNDIWFCGIIGCFILYGILVKLALNIYKNSTDNLLKFSAVHILLCFFVFNIKASAYGYNPGAATVFTILFTLNYYISTNN